jgi:hypothetical protein
LTFSFIVAGTATLMTPPNAQLHVESAVNAGNLATLVFGAPGVHGVDVAGTHGPGVSTPRAAAVSAAVAGLVSDVHRRNGAMFMIGMWSIVFAIGFFSNITRSRGGTISVLGIVPLVHCNAAPMTTGFPMGAKVPVASVGERVVDCPAWLMRWVTWRMTCRMTCRMPCRTP